MKEVKWVVEAYVTLAEAAELEGVKYKTMAQRLSRKNRLLKPRPRG